MKSLTSRSAEVDGPGVAVAGDRGACHLAPRTPRWSRQWDPHVGVGVSDAWCMALGRAVVQPRFEDPRGELGDRLAEGSIYRSLADEEYRLFPTISLIRFLRSAFVSCSRIANGSSTRLQRNARSR